MVWWKARCLPRDEGGANLVEYMLLVVLIAVVVILVITGIGGELSNKYSNASAAIP
jgi:Flp pilus assembly pilin Flp